ncbi:MAG: glyoxalase [Butyrivibrio sp.]
MSKLDRMCAETFLRQQEKLFPKPVADTIEEAEEFLEDCFAQVFSSKEELIEYLEEEGFDYEEEEDITEALEVFILPDGRLMYVEA